MKKRCILLLTVLMAASILCGCGQQQVNAKPSVHTSTSSTGEMVELNQKIYKKNGLTISIQSIEKQSSHYLFRFSMQNKSKSDITNSTCSDVFIDDYGIPASGGQTVNPVKGKTGYSEIYFLDQSFKDIGLDLQSAKTVEGVFTIWLDNDWSNSIAIPFSLDLSKLFAQSSVEPSPFDGRVLYSEGNITVGVQALRKTDWYYLLIVRVENMSNYDITFTRCSDSYLDDCGVVAANGATSAPPQGKTGFEYWYFNKDSIEKAGLDFEEIKLIEGTIELTLGEGSDHKIAFPFQLQLKDFDSAA